MDKWSDEYLTKYKHMKHPCQGKFNTQEDTLSRTSGINPETSGLRLSVFARNFKQMKIILFGSIAAGKTTIARKIKEIYKDFQYIAIDDYRKKFGDYTKEGEEKAHKNFIKSIKPEKDQIVEASGLGKLGRDIQEKLSESEENILVIILRIPIEEINQRIENKVWDTPFPGKQEKLESIIMSLNLGLDFGEIPMLWSINPKHTILQIENPDRKSELFVIEFITKFYSGINS